jgi:hypothetical protein
VCGTDLATMFLAVPVLAIGLWTSITGMIELAAIAVLTPEGADGPP